MEKYHCSEAREYSFGEVDFNRKLQLTRDLSARLANPNSHKIDEAIAFGVSNDGEDFHQFRENGDYNEGLLNPTFRHVYGGTDIVTEQLYERNGKLMVAPDLATLASFRRQRREVILTIHPLKQIGVNPQFLYDFADQHGRRIS